LTVGFVFYFLIFAENVHSDYFLDKSIKFFQKAELKCETVKRIGHGEPEEFCDYKPIGKKNEAAGPDETLSDRKQSEIVKFVFKRLNQLDGEVLDDYFDKNSYLNCKNVALQQFSWIKTMRTAVFKSDCDLKEDIYRGMDFIALVKTDEKGVPLKVLKLFTGKIGPQKSRNLSIRFISNIDQDKDWESIIDVDISSQAGVVQSFALVLDPKENDLYDIKTYEQIPSD